MEIEQLVSETVELTGASPPAVMDDDAPVLAAEVLRGGTKDEGEIYLVGLIGGKDVGKSSLVNALVGQQITPPTSHGRGTERAIAYAHEDASDDVARLLERELPGRFTIIVHHNDALRRQVLLDLPDIDSHYADHIQTTRRMLRHILYPIWIQSIEKYADLAPQQLLAKVAAGNDPANFLFTLNKIDQLLSRESPEALRELQEDYARRIARTLTMSQRPRVYLISATQPDQGDLPALQQMLAREKPAEMVGESRELAGRRRDRTLLAWLDEQGLSDRGERLERLQREAEELLAERVGVPLLERVIPRLSDDPGLRLAIIEPAVQKRLSRWPIVNILDSALSPLVSLVRVNVSRTSSGSAGRALDAYLEPEGRTIASLVQSAFAQLHQTHPPIGELYRINKLWDDLPSNTAAGELRRRIDATHDRQRDAIMQRIGGRYGVIAPLFRWLLTYGAILWFPFVQPILEAWLRGGLATTARELLLLGVQMMSVTYLLSNVTFLLIWFAALWLILRFGTQRRASRSLERWTRNMDVRDLLSLPGQVLQWMDDLLAPIRAQRERIESITRRADEARATLHRSAA
jgi:GTPase Era involved in 16S rRNA processing